MVFLTEYVTGWSSGLDRLWFPDAVRAMEQPWPGRPGARTALSELLLSAAVGLTWLNRRWTPAVWLVSLAGAWTLSMVAIVMFLFGFARYAHESVPPSSQVKTGSLLCVALLAFAAAAVRPERNPVAWVLGRADRVALIQMAVAFVMNPVLVVLIHGHLWRSGVSADQAWVGSMLMAFAACGTAMFAIYNRDRRQRQEGEAQFRSIVENAPNAVAVFNHRGHFEYANRAFGDLFPHLDRDDIVGRAPEKLHLWGAATMPIVRHAQLAALGGEASKFEFAADGERLTVEVQLFPVRDGRGKTFCVGGIGTDVTERRQVERRLRERLEFEEFIARSINDGRLVVFSQPIVEALTGQLVEEELLVRIVGPDGGLIVPADFLPQAQRFGLMPTIDKFMVARGVELAHANRSVAVNLSGDSINDPATVAAITDELRQAAHVIDRVSFEITESTALASTEVAKSFSDKMRSLGCKLALDDFGTGFGSFTELRGMNLHSLKIDRSFVDGLLKNKQDESIVKVTVGIAREFGLVTTAEGIEDAETKTRLVELGVDQLQGHLIGAPTPVAMASGA